MPRLRFAVSPVQRPDGQPVTGLGRSVLAGTKLGDADLGDPEVRVMDLAAYVKRDQIPAAGEVRVQVPAGKDGIAALRQYNKISYNAKRRNFP